MSSTLMALSPGYRLGDYEIVSFLGAGGMGEVYCARDTKLGRSVALKILGRMSSDPDRLRRFEQEARAMAALNHPNIVAIYQFGTHNGVPYLVSELLEGQTLRDVVRGGPLPGSRVVDCAIQVAEGLHAAHSRGVVHRDLKPENIFVTKEGRTKLLDFGIAKLVEPDTSSNDSTISKRTDPGAILGTVGYMSPEQIRGQGIDHRTDIFALGAVLYESLSGERPFRGVSSADILSSILREDPLPLANVGIAPALEMIVRRCLQKNPEQRFQSAADLAFALKALSDIPSSGQLLRREHAASYRIAIIATGLSFLTVVLALGWHFLRLPSQRRDLGVPQQSESIRMTRLTGSGRALLGAISPDRKYVAYVRFDGQGQQAVILRHVETQRELTLVQRSKIRIVGLAFSRDNNYVYYVSKPAVGGLGKLYRIGLLGGNPQELIEDIDSGIGFSSDNRYIAYLRDDPDKSLNTALVANSDGTGEHTILSRNSLELRMMENDRGPAWSPNSKTIALTVLVPGRGHPNILAMSPRGENPSIICDGWLNIDSLDWRDEGHLIVSGTRHGVGRNQIWLVSYPECSVQRITNDTNSYTGVSISADFSSVLTVQEAISASIWLVASPTSSKQIGGNPGAEEGRRGIAWMKDGTILYTQKTSENTGLAVMDPQNSSTAPLTLDSNDYLSPSVSPDGDRIAVESGRGGPPFAIWIMNRTGSALKRLSESFGIRPMFSADGKWIYFFGRYKETYGLQRVPVDGGSSQQLIGPLGISIGDSLDSRLVATWESNENGSMWRVLMTPLSGGPTEKASAWIPQSEPLISGTSHALPRLSADRNKIMYVSRAGDIENLWSRDFDGSRVSQLSHFSDAGQIFSFAVAPDGRIAVSRGTNSSDVVLINSGN
jgi:eukaryotic-like serine/threonine-protein kinase